MIGADGRTVVSNAPAMLSGLRSFFNGAFASDLSARDQSNTLDGLRPKPRQILVSKLRRDVVRFVDFAMRTLRHNSGVGSLG